MEEEFCCLNCRYEYGKGYCVNCYLKIQSLWVGKVMEGDVDSKVVESIRMLKWDLEDKMVEFENDLKQIKNALQDFKIRGLKLKSVKQNKHKEKDNE